MATITNYSDMYALVRHRAGDFGTYDGTTLLSAYRYQNAVIDAAITYNLMKMSGYSKANGADQVTPVITDDDDIGYLTCATAFDLVVADYIAAYRTRNISIAKKIEPFLAAILHDLQQFANAKGITYKKDGALEKLYDIADRTEKFINANI